MAYYKKYSGGGFYDKKSGRWISSTRAHQRVGESIAYYADFATPFHVPLLHRSAVG